MARGQHAQLEIPYDSANPLHQVPGKTGGSSKGVSPLSKSNGTRIGNVDRDTLRLIRGLRNPSFVTTARMTAALMSEGDGSMSISLSSCVILILLRRIFSYIDTLRLQTHLIFVAHQAMV